MARPGCVRRPHRSWRPLPSRQMLLAGNASERVLKIMSSGDPTAGRFRVWGYLLFFCPPSVFSFDPSFASSLESCVCECCASVAPSFCVWRFSQGRLSTSRRIHLYLLGLSVPQMGRLISLHLV